MFYYKKDESIIKDKYEKSEIIEKKFESRIDNPKLRKSH